MAENRPWMKAEDIFSEIMNYCGVTQYLRYTRMRK